MNLKNFSNITNIDTNANKIIKDNSNINNNYLIKGTTILNFLIEQNKSKIYYIIFLSIIRIILMILISSI